MQPLEHTLPEPQYLNAKIGFIIFFPFEFYVLKNVYKELPEKAEFIIDGGRSLEIVQPEEVLRATEALLKKNSVPFRTFKHEMYGKKEEAENFFKDYKVLVSLRFSGSLLLTCNSNKRKVHLNYGAGKEVSMFALHQRHWDLILCLGPRSHNILQYYTHAPIIGYPKFDDWFNDTVDSSSITQKLDARKKTILYLPTHGDLSSIEQLAEPLENNSSEYNVIVKLHYYTSHIEPARKALFRNKNIFLFQDDEDLLPLLKVTDVVVSDNSSAIFDAILADKPVAVTNFLSQEYIDVTHKKIKQYPFRPVEGALTYSQSIEQKIKKEKRIITIENPEKFREAIKDAIKDAPHFKAQRQKLREEVFSFNDGKCGARAAQEIEKLILLQELPKKPILYHAFEAARALNMHNIEANSIELT